jgi:hypothetical protein
MTKRRKNLFLESSFMHIIDKNSAVLIIKALLKICQKCVVKCYINKNDLGSDSFIESLYLKGLIKKIKDLYFLYILLIFFCFHHILRSSKDDFILLPIEFLLFTKKVELLKITLSKIWRNDFVKIIVKNTHGRSEPRKRFLST